MDTNGLLLVEGKGGVADIAAPPSSIFIASLALIAAVGAGICGLDLNQPFATFAACSAILLFGLPHGTLDLELLRGGKQRRNETLPVLILMYLSLAMGTYWVWSVSPVLSLFAFLVIAIGHFAEDWHECSSPLLCSSIALATLAAPVIGHRGDIMSLFVKLTGQPEAAFIAEMLVLIAPVALVAGGVGCIDLLRNGHSGTAVSGMISIFAMLLLPPLVGFAIFFCLIHSPKHLRANVQQVLHRSAARLQMTHIAITIVAISAAALGITMLVFALQAHGNIADRLFGATFLTLSILTVPHILMPMLVSNRGRLRMAAWLPHTVATTYRET